jgi:hypothetical protein
VNNRGILAVVRHACSGCASPLFFSRVHIDEASFTSMPAIEWNKSIYERFANRTKVQVTEGHPVLAGKIGTIMKAGFQGKNMFYELQIQGRGKKVVSANYCKLLMDYGDSALASTDDRLGHCAQKNEVAGKRSYESGQGSRGKGDMSFGALRSVTRSSSLQDSVPQGNGNDDDTEDRLGHCAQKNEVAGKRSYESGQGSRGKGDMSFDAPRSVTRSSSLQDSVPQGNGKDDDGAGVRQLSLRSSSLEQKRQSACELLATECAQRKVSADASRHHIAGFAEVFKGLQFEEFMRLLIGFMQTLDTNLYNKKVCSRVLNEAWSEELVCGIKLGEWASGKKQLVLDGLSEASINTFREYTKILASKVSAIDLKNKLGNDDAGSQKSVCDMSMCN